MRLPDTAGRPNRVVMWTGGRFAYDQAIRMPGAHIVEVATREEFEAALGPGVVLIAVLGTKEAESPIRLEEIAVLARPRDLPVLVDAASEHLELPNPWLARGATMVAYSGGKYLRGPQPTGLLIGERRWIETAWLNAAPHHSFGRAMKVGKEEIVGLLAAIEHWAASRDHAAERQRWSDDLETIADAMAAVRGVIAEMQRPAGATERVPRLRIDWSACGIAQGGLELREALLAGEPRIMLDDRGATSTSVIIHPFCLEPGEATNVGRALAAALLPARRRQAAQPPEPAAELAGKWDVTLAFLRAETPHHFTLAQRGGEITGEHHARYSAGPIEGRIAGDAVELASLLRFESTNLAFRFRGRVVDGAMAGEVELGTDGNAAPGPINRREYGRANWRATRRP